VPLYSPEINPEGVWLYLKERFLSPLLDNYEVMLEVAFNAWTVWWTGPGKKSLCSYPWIPTVKD
jgi:hypothetical protein